MSYGKDKVNDILVVLESMRCSYSRKGHHNRNTTELRKNAVNEIAEHELQAKRYLNLISAKNTIHDACARRLKPDVKSISHFDELADQWLRQNSTALKDVLLKHSEFSSQRTTVINFFD
jgi:hypothetical protein